MRGSFETSESNGTDGENYYTNFIKIEGYLKKTQKLFHI